ncbi:uncharacterized protein LOC121636350 [Melanotaenia boesemani]|uniref:uncharacterized protein LOC121636350 n=1 Tax=Melanotaenia boesemani TaxID=1250792 RepID=UPI001C03E3AC|nr:uncharacterized protein LOC121636350 [Melanotaenia boesemani]
MRLLLLRLWTLTFFHLLAHHFAHHRHPSDLSHGQTSSLYLSLLMMLSCSSSVQIESLASQIIKYEAYPSSADFDAVSEALVKKHLCLKEQGSVSGFYGWKISLKYKMANYRTKLRNIGCSELNLNSFKRKQGVPRTSPNQVKKARRAEVNYCPDYPAGQSQESHEEERLALLSDVRKSNNQQVVKEKMEKTFAYRRHEVIEDRPFIAELKRRWPALFFEHEVEAEFIRITTVPLRPTFMHQLDHHSTKLMTIFKRKGGAAGHKIRSIMADLDKNDTIEMRRACVLKALMVYLNEDPENLIKEYLDVEDNQDSMDRTVLGIFAMKKEGAEPKDDRHFVWTHIRTGLELSKNTDTHI